MATDFKLLFYIKETEVKTDGTCLIMERISIGKTMAQFSTKQTATVSPWDTRANRMSGKSTTLDHPSRYLARDMFLFSVFTGLAYRDVCNLTPKRIVKADDGVLWIRTTRQKTGTPCDIPLLEIPKQIIEKYKGIAKDGKLLPMLSCGRLNKNLKVIAKLCKIDRKLIYHAGRHTYATEICLITRCSD